MVRGQPGSDDKDSELKLANPFVSGQPVSPMMDRHLLLRALQLGFTEVEIAQADRPVCCRDARRVFVWMPLGDPPAGARQPAPATSVNSPSKKEEPTMPDTNGKHPAGGDGHGGFLLLRGTVD